MIVPVMAISNLVLTQQIYSEETNGAHAHYREPVPLRKGIIRHGMCVIGSFVIRLTIVTLFLITPFGPLTAGLYRAMWGTHLSTSNII